MRLGQGPLAFEKQERNVQNQEGSENLFEWKRLRLQRKGCAQEAGHDTREPEAENQPPIKAALEQEDLPDIAAQVNDANEKKRYGRRHEQDHDRNHNRRRPESCCRPDSRSNKGQ